MSNVTLRPATESDWDFLCVVQEACMREYAEATWGKWVPEPRDNFRLETHQVIQCDGDDIGCIALIDEAEALMLEKFYVLPSHQNRGIGTLLLRRLIDGAHTRGKPIRLRVLRVNPARLLYERNGFHIDRSTDERHFMSYAVRSNDVHSRESNAVHLLPMSEGAIDRQALFALYKRSLHEYIDQTFGWDEDFQQDRFSNSYPDPEISLIVSGSTTVGYVALRNEPKSLHLSLLLLQPESRNRGIGRTVMQTLMSRAAAFSQPVTLSCFVRNRAAISFYQKLGFCVVTEDEHFVTYRSPIPDQAA
ncbi:GNAT family N-acetyltransferase [Paraburkholderia acidicola]|uniref:GNAT family N-acetyltransferase n=1 Tax=Paraburkholderia acidicola TaxID=1912599 RepID=A0ABV1LJP6_9BURK